MKKYIFTFIFVFIIANCLLYPQIARKASGDGIVTWFYQILPSLLPFTILSGIFLRSQWMEGISGKSPLIPLCIILCCGVVFGFPIGAKLSCDFYTQGYISKSQAEVLSICTNNFSPIYVSGFVVPMVFGISTVSFLLLFLIYAIPVLIGIILLIYVGTKDTTQKKSASRFQLDMQIIDAGIISGFETLIKICGYIVLFSLITSFCMHFTEKISLIGLFFLGNLEISNGVTLLSDFQTEEPTKFILMIQMLSFGGISGLAQTASFLAPAGLSIKNYIIGKTAISGILTGMAAILPFLIRQWD